jgi:hypothetical protein
MVFSDSESEFNDNEYQHANSLDNVEADQVAVKTQIESSNISNLLQNVAVQQKTKLVSIFGNEQMGQYDDLSKSRSKAYCNNYES